MEVDMSEQKRSPQCIHCEFHQLELDRSPVLYRIFCTKLNKYVLAEKSLKEICEQKGTPCNYSK